jgi:class 3 adenylate cyclase
MRSGSTALVTVRVERKVAAILAADIASHSRLMGADEEGTHERVKAHFRQLFDPKIKEHRGRIVRNTGDGMHPATADSAKQLRLASESIKELFNNDDRSGEECCIPLSADVGQLEREHCPRARNQWRELLLQADQPGRAEVCAG